MGFIVSPKSVRMPDSLVGVYLLPYAWMKYGLEFGYLTIQDNKFYDTVQGAMYLRCQKIISEFDFAVYDPGVPGVIQIIHPSDSRRLRDENFKFTDPYKVAVYPYHIDIIASLTPAGQKTVSNGMIQLLKGCNVKMNQTVWF